MKLRVVKRMPAKKLLAACVLAAAMTSCQLQPVSASSHEVGQQEMNIKERIDTILNKASTRPASMGSEVWGKEPCVMHELPTESRDEGGTLLFSDSPEYVKQDGVLYRDTVAGDARVFYYHLNNTDVPKKLAVVLRNKYDGVNIVKVTRGGSGAPSKDYLFVGKTVQLDYFAASMDETLVLTRDGRRLLQDSMAEVVLKPDELVAGMYDFQALHPVEVSVLMVGEDADPLQAAYELPILPKDEMRLRGTFTGMNRQLTVTKCYDPAKDGVMYFRVADDERDKFRDGIDATDGSKASNEGNYGVVYRIHIPIKGNQPVQYFLSPLGGVYAGAIRAVTETAEQKLLPVPAKAPFFGAAILGISKELLSRLAPGDDILVKRTELSDLGIYPSDQSVWFYYSPPGASNLPVNIIVKPAP